MVSKNNQWQHLQASAQRLPHYGLRKLSVGVASVLLSTTLYMGATAHADIVNSQNYEMLDSKVANNSNSNGDSVVNRGTNAANTDNSANATLGDSHAVVSVAETAVKNEANAKPQVTEVNNDNHMQSGAADANAKLDTKTSSNETNSAVATETSPVPMLHSALSSSQGVVTAPVEGDASNKANNQVQPSSTTDAIQIKPVHRPVMRLAVATTTNSDELIVGKDVTISDFSVTAAEGKNEFENSHANIKFTMHADDPSALAGKRLTIQLGKIWNGFYSSEKQDSNPATISYQGQVIGTFHYGYPYNFVYITFNDHVKNYAKIDVQSDLVVAGSSQRDLLYDTSLYTSTQAKDGQTYYLTNDVTIGQQKYSSNLPSVIHYRSLASQAISSVTDVTTTSYSQSDSELYAGTFYKTPNGIYYSQSSYSSGSSHLYAKEQGQPGYLYSPDLYVGNDVVTDHTQSYTATIDIDQTKLSLDRDSKLMPITSYSLTKNYWDDKYLLPNTSDVYFNYSQVSSPTTTADATVTKNGIIFNKLNGQSLSTQRLYIDSPTYHTSFTDHTNYISQANKLYLTPALFKQLQAVVESDQNLTEAVNTIKTTGWYANIKLANPINTGLKATIKTSDGKTKEVSLLIDTIDYRMFTASTAPKGSILVAAQGKTAKVYHPGDQNIPAVVDQSQLTKTITRTINVHEPGKSVTTIKQTVMLTQSVSVVDGKDVTYNGDWKARGDSQWDSYDVPSVPGYTVSQSYFAQRAVTDTTQDQTVNVTYTANDHQISIEYVDNAIGQVVKTDHMSGKTGQTVSITPHVPDGWELVSGQSVPSEVTLGADGAPVTVIKVQPQERSVAVKFVDDQSDERQVGQAITLTGRDGGRSNLNLTVPDKYRLADGQQLPTTYTFKKGSGDLTIHLVHKVVQREAAVDVQLGLATLVDLSDEDDPGIVVTQNQWTQLNDEIKKSGDHNHLEKVIPTVGVVGTLTGHVNYDLVDNKVVSFGNDWTSLNLGGQTYQMPDGTEVVNGIIVGTDLSWGEKLREHALKYTDDPDYINRAWHGYLSVNKSDIPSDLLVGNESNALAKATDDRAATAIEMPNKPIDLSSLREHVMFGGLSNFNEKDGQLRAKAIVPVGGFYIPYVEKTATRTINVTTPDGKTTTVKQTATLAKQVTAQEDAHPDWTTDEWTSYDVPTIPGYTASQLNVTKEAVTGTTKDQTVNITYTANSQTTTVVYQTEDGTPVYTTTVKGQTGQTVKVSNEVPTGWRIVNGNVPNEITFAPNGTPQTVVTIAHSHVTVTSDAPKTTSDKLPDNSGKTYPAGVSHDDLNKTVTRTIKVTTPDGQTKTVAQTAKLTRTADVDEVTGEVKYSDWTTGNWLAYTAPSVPGYTASQSNVAKEAVTGTTKDQIVSITYTANPQSTTVNYVDQKGKIIHTTLLKGVTDQTVTVPNEVPDGWVTYNPNMPTRILMGASPAYLDYLIGHRLAFVKASDNVKAGDLISGTKTKTFNDQVNADKLVTHASYTVNIWADEAHTYKLATKTYHADFVRNAVFDAVTGEVYYYNWSEDGKHVFAGFTRPAGEGYQAVVVPSWVATSANPTKTLDLVAQPQQVSGTIQYQTADGTVVSRQTFTGNKVVTLMAPKGYTLMTNVAAITPALGQDQVYTVYVRPTQTLYTEADKLPEGMESLSKTITRTVYITEANGRVRTITQRVRFTRTATVKADGTITYSDWQSTGRAVWNKVFLPKRHGYHLVMDNDLAKLNVTANMSDAVVNVKYVKD